MEKPNIKALFHEMIYCKDPVRLKEIKKIMHQFLLDKGYEPNKDLRMWVNTAKMDKEGLGFDKNGMIVAKKDVTLFDNNDDDTKFEEDVTKALVG